MFSLMRKWIVYIISPDLSLSPEVLWSEVRIVNLSVGNFSNKIENYFCLKNLLRIYHNFKLLFSCLATLKSIISLEFLTQNSERESLSTECLVLSLFICSFELSRTSCIYVFNVHLSEVFTALFYSKYTHNDRSVRLT